MFISQKHSNPKTHILSYHLAFNLITNIRGEYYNSPVITNLGYTLEHAVAKHLQNNCPPNLVLKMFDDNLLPQFGVLGESLRFLTPVVLPNGETSSAGTANDNHAKTINTNVFTWTVKDRAERKTLTPEKDIFLIHQADTNTWYIHGNNYQNEFVTKKINLHSKLGKMVHKKTASDIAFIDKNRQKEAALDELGFLKWIPNLDLVGIQLALGDLNAYRIAMKIFKKDAVFPTNLITNPLESEEVEEILHEALLLLEKAPYKSYLLILQIPRKESLFNSEIWLKSEKIFMMAAQKGMFWIMEAILKTVPTPKQTLLCENGLLVAKRGSISQHYLKATIEWLKKSYNMEIMLQTCPLFNWENRKIFKNTLQYSSTYRGWCFIDTDNKNFINLGDKIIRHDKLELATPNQLVVLTDQEFNLPAELIPQTKQRVYLIYKEWYQLKILIAPNKDFQPPKLRPNDPSVFLIYFIKEKSYSLIGFNYETEAIETIEINNKTDNETSNLYQFLETSKLSKIMRKKIACKEIKRIAITNTLQLEIKNHVDLIFDRNKINSKQWHIVTKAIFNTNLAETGTNTENIVHGNVCEIASKFEKLNSLISFLTKPGHQYIDLKNDLELQEVALETINDALGYGPTVPYSFVNMRHPVYLMSSYKIPKKHEQKTRVLFIYRLFR